MKGLFTNFAALNPQLQNLSRQRLVEVRVALTPTSAENLQAKTTYFKYLEFPCTDGKTERTFSFKEMNNGIILFNAGTNSFNNTTSPLPEEKDSALKKQLTHLDSSLLVDGILTDWRNGKFGQGDVVIATTENNKKIAQQHKVAPLPGRGKFSFLTAEHQNLFALKSMGLETWKIAGQEHFKPLALVVKNGLLGICAFPTEYGATLFPQQREVLTSHFTALPLPARETKGFPKSPA